MYPSSKITTTGVLFEFAPPQTEEICMTTKQNKYLERFLKKRFRVHFVISYWSFIIYLLFYFLFLLVKLWLGKLTFHLKDGGKVRKVFNFHSFYSLLL